MRWVGLGWMGWKGRWDVMMDGPLFNAWNGILCGEIGNGTGWLAWIGRSYWYTVVDSPVCVFPLENEHAFSLLCTSSMGWDS